MFPVPSFEGRLFGVGYFVALDEERRFWACCDRLDFVYTLFEPVEMKCY